MVRSKQAIRNLKKQYYTNNRDSILKREKQRYSSDQAHREVKIERAKQRYSTDQAYREVIIERAKENSKMCYHNDEDYRHAKIETAKQKIKESYHNDEDYSIKYKKNQKQRYSTVQVYREAKIETAKQKIKERYWGDKIYNEKIKFSVRLYRRTHKDRGKNYIQKYKKMAKMQADLCKLRNILRMFYWDHKKYSKLQIKILFERADAV